LSENQNKIEDTPPAANPKADGDVGFVARIEKAFKEALNIKFKEVDRDIDARIKAQVEQLELESERKLRAALGVEEDPVVHQSDLVAAIRKAFLEFSGAKNQAPAATEKAGPAGNQPDDPFDALEKLAIAGAQ